MGKGKELRILAVDPGTRHMGFAVLEGGALLYHDVKTIGRRGSPGEILEEGRRVVARFIEDFRPGVLAVEKAFFARNRNTAVLNALVDEIRILGGRKGLQVVSLAPTTVKQAVCGDGLAKKDRVARAVCSIFPELRVYLSQDRRWKERYHSNRYDAVALTIATARRVAGKEGFGPPRRPRNAAQETTGLSRNRATRETQDPSRPK